LYYWRENGTIFFFNGGLNKKGRMYH
jgi:hypothetical protein